MPSPIDTFALKAAKDGFARALRKIKRTDGYNTDPSVHVGARQFKDVPINKMPFLAIEFGDMGTGENQFGGASTGTIRMVWAAFVWGYVGTSGERDDLYNAGLALMADVYAAIYENETLRDADGQDTVIGVEPGEIVFDMEQFSAENRGYFLAEFKLYVDLNRGGTP